jgi:surfeit locus 1 family protein
MLLKLFSRRWLLTTLLVVAASVVMVRLGIWQLERLEQRRAFNARVQAQIDQPTLNLNQRGAVPADDLVNMEYRKVTVVGIYDHSQEVALKNQAHDNQWGVNLLTPLKMAGTGDVILVNRGWIPAEDFTSGDWSRYTETGTVEVQGVLRRSQSRPDFGRRSDPTPAPGGERITAWNFANVEAIDQQTPYDLLPVYIQEAPDPEGPELPYRSLPALNLTEGPHMGYAIQWFAFAAILAFGYPFFMRKEEARKDSAEPSGIQKA